MIILDQNRFNKKLKDTTGIEREKLVLDIELQDQTATAEWFLDDKPITTDDRVEIKNLGGGKHQLVFNKLSMDDEGEISCRSGPLSSSCKLTVRKGESTPVILGPERVDGPVSKPIVFEVPYKSKLYCFVDF